MLLCLASPSLATAAPPAPPVTPAPPAAPDPAPNPDRAITAKAGKGFTVTSANGKYSLTLRPRIQLRETFTYEDPDPSNEINVKTMRLTMSGHVLSKDLGYRIQLAFGPKDFEAGNASPIFDAYLEYTRVKSLSIRVGQFFVPFDRLRTVREFALQMADRPRPSASSRSIATSASLFIQRSSWATSRLSRGGSARSAAVEPT